MSENCRLYLGDCLVGMRDISERSVHCIVTDPPYFIDYVTNHRSKINVDDISRPVMNDQQWNPEWFDKVMSECHRVLDDNTHIYVFCSDEYVDRQKPIFEKYFTFKNILAWGKEQWSAGDLDGQYAKEMEFILFGHKGRREFIGGRPTSLIRCPRVSPEKMIHNCQKPIPLISFLISHSTHPGETVCDPFSGSGTTAVAAMGLGRQFIGWELDPKTYEIARARLEMESAQKLLF